MNETEGNYYKELLIKYIKHIEYLESSNYIEFDKWKCSGILNSEDASTLFNIINNYRINKNEQIKNR